MFFQLLPAFHLDYGLVADEFGGIQERLGQLVVKVSAVRNQHYGRTAQRFGAHELPGQEQHRVRLSATGSPEVGTAFPVAGGIEPRMFQDMVVQLRGGEVLRIAAHNFVLAFGRVRQEDEVVQHVQQAFPSEQSAHHGEHRVECTVKNGVGGFHFVPSVEIIVGRKERTDFI